MSEVSGKAIFFIQRSFVETEKSSIQDCALGVKSPSDHFPISYGPRKCCLFTNPIAYVSPLASD